MKVLSCLGSFLHGFRNLCANMAMICNDVGGSLMKPEIFRVEVSACDVGVHARASCFLVATTRREAFDAESRAVDARQRYYLPLLLLIVTRLPTTTNNNERWECAHELMWAQHGA